MRRRGKATFTALLIAGLGALWAAPGAGAATIYAGPLASSFNYLTPKVTIARGESLTFSSFDIVSHDVISRQTYRPRRRRGQRRRPPPRPLFESRLASLGDSVPVTGTARLQSGQSYGFFCSLHPSMSGTLRVR